MIKEMLCCYRLLKLISIFSLVLLNMTLFSHTTLGAPTLTRDKATSLIGRSNEFREVKSKIALYGKGIQTRSFSPGLQKGLWYGLWVQSNPTGPSSVTFPEFTITERGAQFIESLFAETYGHTAFITLKKPANIKVKVTGITGVGNSMSAEFTYEYIEVPSLIKRYVVRGGSGVASFMLYDDGWRLQTISYKPFFEKASQNAKDIADDMKWISEAKNYFKINSKAGIERSFKTHQIMIREDQISTAYVVRSQSNPKIFRNLFYGFEDINDVTRFYDPDEKSYILQIDLIREYHWMLSPIPGVSLSPKTLKLSFEKKTDVDEIYDYLSSAIKNYRDKLRKAQEKGLIGVPIFSIGIAGSDDPYQGMALFTGEKKFMKGGPPCIQCHRIGDNFITDAIGGGVQGPNLSIGPKGGPAEFNPLMGIAWINNPNHFPPRVEPVYSTQNITDEEINHLKLFFAVINAPTYPLPGWQK